MTNANNFKGVFYRKPEDWLEWSMAFRKLAESSRILRYIEKLRPWPIEPEYPDPRDYQQKPRNPPQALPEQPGPSGNRSERGRTTDTQGPSRVAQARNRHQDEDDRSDSLETDHIVTVADLTPDGLLTYNDAINRYKVQEKIWDTTSKAQRELNQWVLSSCRCLTNETRKREQNYRWQEKGIKAERCAPHTQEQNGGAERSGGVIKIKARTMRTAARLPADLLWVEIYKAAVYLHNRTPQKRLGWLSPYEVFHTYVAHRDGIPNPTRKPKMHHLRNYGCRAYAMTTNALKKTNRRNKLDPNAWIGYLVGYDSTNIYRIWVPKLNRVIRTRDVIFDEDSLFDGNIEQFKDDLCRITQAQMEELVASCELQGEQIALNNFDTTLQGLQTQEQDDELTLDEIVCAPTEQHPYAAVEEEHDTDETMSVLNDAMSEQLEASIHSSQKAEMELEVEYDSSKLVGSTRLEPEYEPDHLATAFQVLRLPRSAPTPAMALLTATFSEMALHSTEEHQARRDPEATLDLQSKTKTRHPRSRGNSRSPHRSIEHSMAISLLRRPTSRHDWRTERQGCYQAWAEERAEPPAPKPEEKTPNGEIRGGVECNHHS